MRFPRRAGEWAQPRRLVLLNLGVADAAQLASRAGWHIVKALASSGMAVVVNFLRCNETIEPNLFARVEREMFSSLHSVKGFKAIHVVQTSPTEVVLFIIADTIEILNQIATEYGSSWMGEHVVPLLAEPPNRHIGPVIGSSD
jgi:hypothetical protein